MKIVKQKILKFTSANLHSNSDLPQHLQDQEDIQTFDKIKESEGLIDFISFEFDNFFSIN